MGRRWIANLDIYRKVPGDLLEGSRRGSIISILALIVIATLFFLETKAFLTTTLATELMLDPNKDEKIQVNFNITMMDLKCEYATIDVVSVLGKEQNVTQNVHKWTVDAEGVKQQYLNRNLQQHDVELHDKAITQSLAQLHANGEDAVSLDATTLQYALDDYTFVFVDFFAGWCSHCQVLAPTYEALAEIMLDAAREHVEKMKPPDRDEYTEEEYNEALQVHMPVLIAKVDCVAHHALCQSQGITGYPTLRLFINGKPYEGGDYWGHRTILAMTKFLEHAEEEHKEEYERVLSNSDAVGRRMNVTEEERRWAESLEETRHNKQKRWNPEDHPGCQLAGFLWMDRAPGHFFIQARSSFLELNPQTTNVSHEIHHLSFGDAKLFIKWLKREHEGMYYPKNFAESLKPFDGNVYVTRNLHEAYHHHIKLVSTNLKSYQVLQSSQLSFYSSDMVPEAKFVIDLSPISVVYRPKKRRWYEYITSLMAIIGGTFTVVGMLESSMRTVSHVATRRRKSRPHGHVN